MDIMCNWGREREEVIKSGRIVCFPFLTGALKLEIQNWKMPLHTHTWGFSQIGVRIIHWWTGPKLKTGAPFESRSDHSGW